MSKGVQCVKQTKSTPTIKNHTYTRSQRTQRRNHLKSSQWTSSRSFPNPGDTTQSSPSRITIAQRLHCSSPVMRPLLVKESPNYTYNTCTLTTVSPRD